MALIRKKATRARKRKAKTNPKSRKHKKAASSRHRRGIGASGLNDLAQLRIAMEMMEQQEAAFLAEMTMQPPSTIGKRIRCSIGVHGNTARRYKRFFADSNGKITELKSWITKHFCVSCGRKWQQKGTADDEDSSR